MNLKGTKKKNQVSNANIFEQQELLKKIEVVRENLTASTWHELETKGKFDKNAKLSFICDDMLILGCDVGSETHYLRAIDTRGRELSKSAFSFSNNVDGFSKAKEWAVKIAAEYDKKQIVLGLEPTGHYWFCLATWMISNGISVVQVNPYAVKQTKELEDNSQLKDDAKDPKLIANLVKDGNFGMPYLPEQLYADLRRLSMFRDQLNEDRIRSINRLHRELKIYFPEYKEALGKTEGTFSLELLKQAPFPDDLAALKEDGIRQIWHNAKLRGRGYSRAGEILEYAKASVGIREGKETGKLVVQWAENRDLQRADPVKIPLRMPEYDISSICFSFCKFRQWAKFFPLRGSSACQEYQPAAITLSAFYLIIKILLSQKMTEQCHDGSTVDDCGYALYPGVLCSNFIASFQLRFLRSCIVITLLRCSTSLQDHFHVV